MVEIIEKDSRKLYECEECGFVYKDKIWAEKCQAWCKEHHTCNVEITARSENNKQF